MELRDTGGDLAAEERSMPAVESGLVDLSGVSLEALRSMDGTAIAESLERLLLYIDNPKSITESGHNPQSIRQSRHNASRFD
jgi:hypothetical protein